MRCLWVKMGGLWPATTGGRTRSLQTIAQLSKRHEVFVITTHGPDDDPEGLRRQLPHCREVTSLPHQVPKRGDAVFPFAVAKSWLSPLPVDLWKWRVPSVSREIRRAIAEHHIDICVADFLFSAANAPMRGATPIVLFEHNVEYLIWQRLAALESRRWRRVLLDIEWRKLRACEAEACRRADLTIAVSDDDRRRLAALAPGAEISSIPTGVDTDYFVPWVIPERPSHLVFSGSMDWHPNEDAVVHFADAILPKIRSVLPETTFTIVGRNPSARVRDLAKRYGVCVTGTVDDVRPPVAEAALYIVPLRAGSGTRMKIFEALAMGKAVLSTTMGAEGLGLEPGRHFAAADDDTAFAETAVALLKNAPRRAALGEAGRHLVETRFSWPIVAQEFERRCLDVVEAHGRTRRAA